MADFLNEVRQQGMETTMRDQQKQTTNPGGAVTFPAPDSPQAYADVYQPAEPDFGDIYDPLEEGGTGSDSADRFVGSMLAMAQMRHEDPDTDPTDVINDQMDMLGTVPFKDVRNYIDGRVGTILQQSAEAHTRTLADLYSRTGDPTLVESAKAEQQAAVSKEQPISNRLVLGALAQMQEKGLTTIDKEFVLRNAKMAMLSEYAEHAGLTDILGTLVPFRNLFELGLGKDLDTKIKNLNALAPEDQVKQFPKIVQDVYEMSHGNKILFAERLMAFIDRDEISKVKEALVFDGVDVASTIPVAKFFRLLKASTTPIKFAATAGDKAMAAKMVDDVLKDSTGRASRATGTERLDAASSALPFGGQMAIPEITNGLSAEVGQVVAERLAKSREFYDKLIYDPNAMIRRGPLNAEEVAARQAAYINNHAGQARIIESDPLGFTAEVQVVNPNKAGVATDIGATRIKVLENREKIAALRQRLEDLNGAHVIDQVISKGQRKKVKDFQSFAGEEADDIQAQLVNLHRENNTLEASMERDVNTPSTLTRTENIRYQWNDVGQMEAITYTNASRHLNSPQTFIDQMQKGLVDEATAINFSQAQMRGHFERAVTQALGGISKKTKEKLSHIILQADRDKIGRYGTMDLVNGIVTRDGGLLRLDTAEEIAAYHGIRDALDAAYIFKNNQLRRELEFEGWQAAVVNRPKVKAVAMGRVVYEPSGRAAMGVPIPKTVEDVVAFVNPKTAMNKVPAGVKRLYDLNARTVVDVTPELEKRFEKGYQVMKAKYPLEHGDDTIEYVLARATELKPLPNRVLAYRPGYVPRIYKNIFYVAEEIGDSLVNGVKKSGVRTVKRYFDNQLDGQKWAATERAKGKTIEVRPGREWIEQHPEMKQDYDAAIFGGIYSGKRSDEVIPFGLEGTEAEHIGAFEAMEKALSHVSTRIPMSEFRMGQIRRFLKSAKNPATGESYLANPGDWRSEITAPKSSKEYQGLKAMQQWMEDQFRIPTEAERNWNNFTMKLAAAVDGQSFRKMTGGLSKKLAYQWKYSIANVGTKDPYGAMRGLAFHSLLGWFNPSQLYVQALGASMAFSLHPERATYLIPRYMALRAAMYGSDKGIWRSTAAAAGVDPTEFEDLVRAFQKAGIRDSVRSTADFDAAIHGYGVTASSLRRVADKGLVFFREGEMFTRSYGWLVAHDEFMRKAGKGYILKDADIDKITKRSLDVTMNLNRANRAHWQKGALSIPTQFLQITAKFIENMGFSLKSGRGRWTPWEKSKIMFGQAALFGAAGVPFAHWGASNLAEWIKSDEDYGLGIKDPNLITAINGGLTEMMLYDWTGEQLQLSNRVAIPNGIESFLEMMLRSDSTLGDKLSGAFGEVPHRFFEAVRDIAPAFASKEALANFDQDVILDAASEVGEITSTWRNINKARVWERSKAILDSKGNPLLPIDPENDHNLILAQKWGLAPRVIEDYYDLVRYNQLNRKDINDVADAWVRVARKYTNSPMAATETGHKRIGAIITWLNEGLTEEQKEDVAKIVMNKLKEDDFKLTKELLDAIDNMQKSHGNTARGVFKGSLELNTIMTDQQEAQEDAH